MEFKVLCSTPPRAELTKIIRIMKVMAIILLAASMHISAKTLGQRITLSLKNVPLEKVFTEIERQSGFSFIYFQNQLGMTRNIDLEAVDLPLEKALDLIFRDQPLTWSIEKNFIVIKEKTPDPALEAGNTSPCPPPIDVHGRVVDDKNQPVPGVTITIKGSAQVTSTDENGEFTLKAVGSDAVLVFSSVNMEKLELNLKGKTELSVSMKPKTTQLSQVAVEVNTGYQILPKERSTGSFATVDNKLFNERVSTDVLSRLEGNVPGMVFNHATIGGTDGGSDINIRGHSTLYSNDQPLIVLDNFVYDGDVNNLNPNDIENITVLKDAAAASIWGVRSGNGVIVITTKKGKRSQALKIELNANVTVGDKPNLYYNPGFLDANDYINIEEKLFNLGYYNATLNDPTGLVSPVVQILADQQSGLISSSDATNRIDSLRKIDVRRDLTKYFYRKSVSQQYAVNIRGGSDKSDYLFSLGDDDDRSNTVGNKNDRLTLKTLLNFYPVKGLQLTGGIAYTQGFVTSNNAVGSFQINPYTQLAAADGTPLAIPVDFSPAYKTSMTNKGLLDWQYKPLAEIGLADNTTKSIDNLMNFGAKYSFLKGFSASLLYQYERSGVISNNDHSINMYQTRDLINRYTQIGSNGKLTYPIPVGGILQQNENDLTSKQFRGQLDYSHSWDKDHQLVALAGAEIRHQITESSGSIAYGYDNNTKNSVTTIDFVDNFSLNPNGSSTIQNPSGYSEATNNFISYYSNAAFTFKNKYILSASGRIDHSNLFGVNTNQKAVPLYSAGLSWNLSREKFYRMEWLPVLTPRFTYGYTANINLSATAVPTIQQYSNHNPFYPSTNDAITNAGNPDLRWEKTKMANIGLDYGLTGNRISGSLEYYWKRGIDLFGSSPLSPSTGVSSFFGNTASTAGKGTDIVINTININGPRFKWTTNFLFSYVLDRVTKYDVLATAYSAVSTSASAIAPVVGEPVFSLYSYRWAGLSHDTGDPQGYVNGKPSNDYATILNNATVDSLQNNGPARPSTFGAIRNTFTFDHFSLSFNILYKFHYYFRKFGISDINYITSVNGFGTGSSDYLKAWQKPGDEAHTNIPSVQYPPYNSDRETFYQYSSVLVDKGDHIRLQDINISYDLDRSQIRKLPLAHLQIYAYASNLGILWRANKDHLDPELYTGGGSIFTNPAPRTYALGIKANF